MTRVFHIILQKLPVFHQNDGLSAEKAACTDAVVDPDGQQKLNGQHHQNWNQAGEQWNALVLHRHGGQVRNEHGDDELRRLQLAELTFAHQPDGENQRQI